MNAKFGKDLTEGSIPKHLLTFSLPMLAGNLLQVAYNVVDTMWVGFMVGQDAVGASTVSFQIMFILIAIASGITLATTILVSQYFGAKNFDMMSRVINNSFTLAIALGAVLTVTGIALSDFFLQLLGTPSSIMALASGYLKINFAGFILMFLSFLASSILRGIGDTMTPLAFMALGTVLNAILDPLLIVGIGPFPKMGLNGAALASQIAQAIAVISALVYLNRKNHVVTIDPRKMLLDRHLTLLTFRIGFPSIIQQSLVAIGSAAVARFVNSFGAAATNAFGGVSRVDNIAFMPAMSIGMAVSALTGQNLGARKPERVREIFKWGAIMTSAITISISLMAVSIPHTLLAMFNLDKDPAILQIGISYLRIVGAGYILFAIMFVSNGVVNGAGHTMTAMMITLISLWGIRVPLAYFLSSSKLGITGIWLSMIISFGFSMTISLLYYASGRWKKVVIKHGPAKPVVEAEEFKDNQGEGTRPLA